MSSNESGEVTSSDNEEQELESFIVSEKEDTNGEDQKEDEVNDRIGQLTKEVGPHETTTQKILGAHISVLVSALGGPDHTSSTFPPPYHLGQDALACLKDIKRWIKSVDERNKSYDVALACSQCSLLTNDLTVILCQWENDLKSKTSAIKAKSQGKIALACLELLVLLTWPIDSSMEQTESQKIKSNSIRKIHVGYKKHILSYKKGQTLRAVIRLALPVVSKNKLDREPKDNAVLRLLLFFIRNVLAIEPPRTSISTKASKQVTHLDNMPTNVNYEDISLNTILLRFKENKVLLFLLTISGSLGTEFEREVFTQPCLECIYLFIKGLKPESALGIDIKESKGKGSARGSGATTKSTRDKSGPSQTSGHGLEELLLEENNRKKAHIKNMSSRHGRFGSLLSLQDDSGSFTISGQEALLDATHSLARLDKTKKWNSRPQFRYDSDEYVKSMPESLDAAAIKIMQNFLDQFLTGGCFNNLIENAAWLISGSHDLHYVDELEKASYFLVVAWFFAFKRIKQSSKHNRDDFNDTDDYSSVGAVLGEVNFILIISYFREAYEGKNWNALHVAMICFKEFLYTSHSIFVESLSRRREEVNQEGESDQDLDRELAEGIFRKLFSFSDFLSIIILIPQTASKHSPDYLSVSISVVHIILKAFECFANEDVKLYVQEKRKTPKKVKNTKLQNDIDEAVEESDEERAMVDAARIHKERKLNFQATELRFFQTSIVSAFIEHLSRYEDLSYEDIKKCLSFFHRLFIVRKDYTGLYRLDFLLLLNNLSVYLPRSSIIKNEVDEFTYHFMKKFKKAFERFPNPIEILFTRIENAEYKTYLGTGSVFERRQQDDKKYTLKLAKSLEFIRPSFSLDEKFKILVTNLYEQEKADLVSLMIREIEKIIEDEIARSAENGSNEATTTYELHLPATFSRLLINNSYLRLMLSLLGFNLPFEMGEQVSLSYGTSTEHLIECLDLLKKWSSLQPAKFEDGKGASFFLRAKEVDIDGFGYDLENYYDENDDSIAFEVNETTNHKRHGIDLDRLDELESAIETTNNSGIRGIARKKRKIKSRKETNAVNEIDEKRRRHSPQLTEVALPVRSTEFVHHSDDETDNEDMREFFEREERLRSLITRTGGVVTPQQLAEFKEAWAKIESNKSTDRITEPGIWNNQDNNYRNQNELFSDVERSSVLFPQDETINMKKMKWNSTQELDGDTDDVNLQETQNSDQSFSKFPRKASRKRRVVLDNDD